MTTAHSSNLLFQSEKHPLVCDEPRSLEEHCLNLIHRKAYEVAAELVAGKVVPDLGCNNGYGARILAESARSVTGVDVSASAIAVAKRLGIPSNVEFRVVDGNLLPFEPGTFDCLISFQVIEHVADVDAYLREAVRVLAPHGIAVFTTPNRHIRLDPGMKPWNPFHVTEFSAEQLKANLSPYFPNVRIRGLFGVDRIQETEFRRVQKAKVRAKSRLRRVAKFGLRHLLPQGVGERTYNLSRVLRADKNKNRYGSAPGSPSIGFGAFSTEDLFYRADDLDRALDLMAVCCLNEVFLCRVE